MTGLPHTAESFKRFMEQIWEIHHEPGPDGGITLYQHDLYDEYHNAVTTARRCGAERIGATKVDGEPWHVFRFPGDNTGRVVRIAADGNQLDISGFFPEVVS